MSHDPLDCSNGRQFHKVKTCFRTGALHSLHFSDLTLDSQPAEQTRRTSNHLLQRIKAASGIFCWNLT